MHRVASYKPFPHVLRCGVARTMAATPWCSPAEAVSLANPPENRGHDRSMVVSATERCGMESLSDTLAQRVEGLIQSHHRTKLLTTTGTRAALEELIERNDGLEQAVRELAAEVQRLAAKVEQPAAR